MQKRKKENRHQAQFNKVMRLIKKADVTELKKILRTCEKNSSSLICFEPLRMEERFPDAKEAAKLPLQQGIVVEAKKILFFDISYTHSGDKMKVIEIALGNNIKRISINDFHQKYSCASIYSNTGEPWIVVQNHKYVEDCRVLFEWFKDE